MSMKAAGDPAGEQDTVQVSRVRSQRSQEKL